MEVITGPMFSGKSEELIRRLKRARIARQRVACFKPDIDLRYHRTAIASHSAQTHDALTVANVAELRRALYQQLPDVEVVGIDEAQFLEPSIVQLAGELVHLGKRVVLAGLDTTFTGEPFGAIPALMAISDEVTKLSAVCMVCGQPAIHTQRLGKSRELVVVGAAAPCCTRCALPCLLPAVTWMRRRLSRWSCPRPASRQTQWSGEDAARRAICVATDPMSEAAARPARVYVRGGGRQITS